MRETWLRPLGLITEPNELGVYPPGALAIADNAVMRRPGLLAGLWSPVSLGSGPPAGERVHRLFSTGQDGQLIYWSEDGGAWTVMWVDGSTYTAATYEDTTQSFTFDEVGRIAPLSFRGRLLSNSDQAIVVADYVDPQTTAERMLRAAGLPQPWIINVSGTTGGGAPPQQAVDPGTSVGYAAVLRRRYEADGYELISAPSPIQEFRVLSTIVAVDPIVTVAWGPPLFAVTGRDGVRVGDVVELYRTAAATADDADPAPAAGATLFLVKRYVITAGDVFNSQATFTDTSGPTALGPELYTNPGQDGAASARMRPPIARCIEAFKGFTFYSNLQLPATWLAGFPGGFGLLDTPASRLAGIGARDFTGVATNGSATITGISAADMEGLEVGQYVERSSPAFSSKIVALGATSIDMFNVWTAPSDPAVELSAVDVVEVDGVLARMGSLASFIGTGGLMWDLNTQAFTGSATRWYSLTTEVNVAPPAFGSSSIYPALEFQQRIALQAYSVAQGNITVRGTNGQNYDPPIPLLAEAVATFEPEEKPNLSAWSWEQQPEGVGPGNYLPIGLAEIYQTVAAGDSLYIFASTGLYRLTGYGVRSSGIGAQWNVDQVDATLILSAPMAAAALRDSVYAYTNRGLVQIRGNVVDELSTGIVGNVLTGPYWRLTRNTFMATDPVNDEVWLAVLNTSDAGGSDVYVYNTLTKAFTRQTHTGPNSFIGRACALHWTSLYEAMAFATYEDSGPQELQYYDPDQSAESDDFHAEYQPVSGSDALYIKQWIDATVVTAPVERDIDVYFGESDEVNVQLVARANDARANVGVPRAAPAVGETLRVGIVAAGSDSGPPVELRGVSVRFEPLSDQQVFR